jgi:anti-sigma regulatory factor (Ser/Thr protein kinase)
MRESTPHMQTCTKTRLRASATSLQAARGIVDEQAELGLYPDLQFAAQLLTSELVANAFKHAGLGVDDLVALCIECSDETLYVEVRDGGAGFDPLAHIAEYQRRNDSYRGLFLVNALADRWGFRRGTNECCLWFELELVPGRRPWRGREAISRGF